MQNLCFQVHLLIIIWTHHWTLEKIHHLGRWDDVQIAAAEIREAAHHFTQLRAERSRIGALQSPLAPSESEPGTVTVKVSEEYFRWSQVIFFIRSFWGYFRGQFIWESLKVEIFVPIWECYPLPYPRLMLIFSNFAHFLVIQDV